jgi:hypothetical protein
MDTFLRRLRALGHDSQSKVSKASKSTVNGSVKGKGKGKEKETPIPMSNGDNNARGDGRGMCVVITKAERLPKVMGQNWTVMTRLAELVGHHIE